MAGLEGGGQASLGGGRAEVGTGSRFLPTFAQCSDLRGFGRHRGAGGTMKLCLWPTVFLSPQTPPPYLQTYSPPAFPQRLAFK